MELRRILVPVDFSEPSRAALEQAARLAARFGACVDLLFVWDGPRANGGGAEDASGDVLEPSRKLMADELEQWSASLRARDVESLALVRQGRAEDLILEIAARGYDLIVMGTHGRTGLTHLVLGSVAERVVRRAACPVITVRAKAAANGAARTIRTILVPTDLSGFSSQAIAWTADLARTLHARVFLLHVEEGVALAGAADPELAMAVPEEHARAARAIRETTDDLKESGLDAIGWIRRGRPEIVIAETAAELDADLIVMATHALKGVERLVIGSVTERVMRTAPCPVLAAPPLVLAGYQPELRPA